MKTPEENISYNEIELQADLTYVEEPSKILAERWRLRMWLSMEVMVMHMVGA
jgi:hypothetical protein